jgi:hypothetical protein
LTPSGVAKHFGPPSEAIMNLFVTADLPAYECADPPLDDLWRSAVGADDLVYILVGDTAHFILPQLDALPGRKRLISGVCAIEGGFVLSVLPLHASQLAPGQINLHGKPLRPLPADPQRLCVSLEATGFRPLRLDRVRELATGVRPPLRLVRPDPERPAERDPLHCQAAE